MESSQHKHLVEQLGRKLVQELVEMRDRQTCLSLLLHDLKFEVDAAHRQAVAEAASECIARSQSRQH